MTKEEIEAQEYAEGWKPILKGDIYCAPRCGGKCTKASYDMAIEQSLELAAQMGDGWKPRVWENMGWHWSVENGNCSIYPSEDRREPRGPDGRYRIMSYTCYFNTDHQFVVSGPTPEEALGLALQDARTMISRIRDDCNRLSG